MKKLPEVTAALALLGASLLFVLPSAGAQSAAAAGAQNDPQLPPGLDTRYLDKTADLCMDFAKYACGNFNKLHPIPPDMSSYGPDAMIFEHTEYALHALLEKVAADRPSRTPNEQKTGDFYATCMNTEAIQAAGLKPLQPEFDRRAGLKDKAELTGLLAHLQLINVNAFFGYGEQQDLK